MKRLGFFSQSEMKSSKPHSILPKCGACGLFKTCKSPKMPISGNGNRKILIVGEAPGKDEDAKGLQFVGVTGQLLEDVLDECGIDMRDDCWLTNTLICRPPDNETPTDKQISYCLPNLSNAIRDLKPRVIIPIGGPAIKAVLWATKAWEDDISGITRWAGFKIPCQKTNAWICPTFHPSYVLRENEARRNEVAEIWFKRHLKAAVRKTKRPWREIPDYASEVQVLFKEEEAVTAIEEIIEDGGPAAFDYETNMLKPDSRQARIVTASICLRGERTIAFPWTAATAHTTSLFLRSDSRKIASNAKFEDRWSRAVLDTPVRGWVWDTMQAAHILDNRKLISGLKFQAFTLLGQPTYDTHIEPFLKSKRSNEENKIDQLDLRDLLVYNGLDSLLEYKVAMLQRELAGYGELK